MQKRHNSISNAPELHLSNTNPSTCCKISGTTKDGAMANCLLAHNARNQGISSYGTGLVIILRIHHQKIFCWDMVKSIIILINTKSTVIILIIFLGFCLSLCLGNPTFKHGYWQCVWLHKNILLLEMLWAGICKRLGLLEFRTFWDISKIYWWCSEIKSDF